MLTSSGLTGLSPLKVSKSLTSSPKYQTLPSLARNVPIVGGLVDESALEDLIPEDDAVDARDFLRLVHDIDDVDLRGAPVLPMLADSQREIGIRPRRTHRVVEACRPEIGIVPGFAEHAAGGDAGVVLVKAELIRFELGSPQDRRGRRLEHSGR